MSSNTRVLAFDQSIRHTGWAAFNINGIETGVFEPKGSQINAILEQYNFARKMLTELHPDWFAMENYAFSMHSANTTKLAEIGGVVRLAAVQLGYRPGENMLIIPPSSAKKFVCGKGNADKNLVMKAAYKRWNFDSDDNNVCDSYVIGRLAMSVADVLEERNIEMSKDDKEVVDKIVKSYKAIKEKEKMTETLFTPEEVENLKEACRIGAGSLGEAAGIDCYAMRKLEARLLALIPDGHALVVRTEPLDLLLDKQQPAFIYVFKPKEGEHVV